MSLSVELQFYLIVPFLFLLFNVVGKILEVVVIFVLGKFLGGCLKKWARFYIN
jgi:peptidoglycan/LPS O-acetylase OafA/YrhL